MISYLFLPLYCDIHDKKARLTLGITMKKILRSFKEKLTFKDLPPPYCENDVAEARQEQPEIELQMIRPLPCDGLDLLANCKAKSSAGDTDISSEAEYAEIQDMGLWHSTPLAHRHKSKISLTWVLKENLERTKLPEKIQNENRFKTATKKIIGAEVNSSVNHKFSENKRLRKCKSGDVRERIVGRNEYYHNLRFRTACEEFVNGQDTGSDDTSIATEEYSRRRHRHRHRRRKRNQQERFGYDIRDLGSFLSDASIDRPGNIPVVIAYPTTLYETHKDLQQELTLPLGTVVNAVFKNQQWLYAQTPHGNEGYVLYSACLPLGILPNRPSPQKKTPCWESSTDIYPRPCGNLTDNEKEQLRGRSRSECRYKPKRNPKNVCAEKDFDTLYLKTKSVCSEKESRKLGKENSLKNRNKIQRQILLIVNSDYRGSYLNQTLTVKQGDVVTLVPSEGTENDGDIDWFYVKKKDGSEGFIPAAIAGHGYI